MLRPVRGTTPDVVAALSAWLASRDEPEPLIVETSGSTGEPKRVLLSRRALLASADATHARLGGPGQWLLALPIGYVAGLQVALRSLRAGFEPIEVDDWTEAITRAAGARSYTSLVPTQLLRLLDDPEVAAALSQLDAVLLGGGPIDPALRARAEAAGVTVVATYGSSETSGGCVYDGVPLEGVQVAIDGEGRIRIGGPTLFDGYDGAPELTARTMRDGWLVTSDLGSFDDGRLRVLGRVDDVVVSGGLNVPAPAVAARLREHPEVAECHVLGVPDDEWGQRVVAFVRLRPETGHSTSENWPLDGVREWVTAGPGIDRRWAPRQVVVVTEFPLLANGKLDRVALREQARASVVDDRDTPNNGADA